MSNVISRAAVLAVALAGLLSGERRATACLPPPGEQLALKSAYSKTVLVPWARQVRLSIELDATGNGSGTLTMDPNIIDEWGSTCIAIQEIPVRVRAIADDGSAAKGRRLYELKRTGDEGKVEEGREHWLLIRPAKEGAPSSLVFVDTDGKVQDVLIVE